MTCCYFLLGFITFHIQTKLMGKGEKGSPSNLGSQKGTYQRGAGDSPRAHHDKSHVQSWVTLILTCDTHRSFHRVPNPKRRRHYPKNQFRKRVPWLLNCAANKERERERAGRCHLRRQQSPLLQKKASSRLHHLYLLINMTVAFLFNYLFVLDAKRGASTQIWTTEGGSHAPNSILQNHTRPAGVTVCLFPTRHPFSRRRYYSV